MKEKISLGEWKNFMKECAPSIFLDSREKLHKMCQKKVKDNLIFLLSSKLNPSKDIIILDRLLKYWATRNKPYFSVVLSLSLCFFKMQSEFWENGNGEIWEKLWE